MTDEQSPKTVAEAVNAQKLDQIIDNVDELKEAVRSLTQSVNRLAILEERLATNADSLGRAFKEIGKHDKRINALELAQPLQKQSSDIVQKVVALVLAAVIGAGAGLVIAPTRKDQVHIPAPAATGK